MKQDTTSTTIAEPILVQIGPGELADRLSILRIRADKAEARPSAGAVAAACARLEALRDRLGWGATAKELEDELARINHRLWTVEDQLRVCEAQGRFDDDFVELARSVYRLNDRRSALKLDIDRLFGHFRPEDEKIYGE